MGVGSSLKSPLCTTRPSGVSKATPAPCGMQWETGTSMKRNGPCCTHSLTATGRRSTCRPASSTRLRASSMVSGVPYTGTGTAASR